MPAVSKKQQKLFAVVKGIQSGKIKADPSKGPAAKVAKTAKKKDVDDFASTKTKNLPDKVKKEAIMKSLIKMIREEIKQQLNEESPIWWTNMSAAKQKAYLKKHPDSRYKVGSQKPSEIEVKDSKNKVRKDKLDQEVENIDRKIANYKKKHAETGAGKLDPMRGYGAKIRSLTDRRDKISTTLRNINKKLGLK